MNKKRTNWKKNSAINIFTHTYSHSLKYNLPKCKKICMECVFSLMYSQA